MEVLHWKFGQDLRKFNDISATIGNFDGVHRGHKKIIEELLKHSKKNNKKSLVITFFPHPVRITSQGKTIFLIQTLEHRIKKIEETGVDFCLVVDFSKKFADILPENFIKDFLSNSLGVSAIFVGGDFTFGKGRSGDIKFLQTFESNRFLKVFLIEPVFINNVRVSSSKIRSALMNGEIEFANSLLGWRWAISGRVIKGRGIGEKIGFPTINIEPENEIIPKEGVYAGELKYKENFYKIAIHIGPKPTFNESANSIEAHIPDFNKNILNEKIEISFFKRIRDVIKFSSIEDLINQIKKDVNESKKIW